MALHPPPIIRHLMGYELKTRLYEEEAKNALVAALGEDDCEGCKI